MGPSQPQTEADLYAFVLGATVGQIRERRGITQGELAKRLGVTQPTISRIERGQALPDAHQLRAISEAFGMAPPQLTAVIEDALQRAKATAKQAVPAKETGNEWWKTALAVVGVAGLGGLVGFATALALNEQDKEPEPKPGKASDAKPPKR